MTTARVSPAKEREAFERAKKLAEYVSTKYSPFSIHAYSEVFGDVGTFHLFGDCANLATLQSVIVQEATDKDYEAMERKLLDLIIEGSEHETLFRSL